MAGKAIGGRSLINAIGMASRAGSGLMVSRQRKTGLTMIEINILPTGCGMTLGAIHTHLPQVDIRMAGGAGVGCTLEDQVFMTIYTGNIVVTAGQREPGFRVIEGNILPRQRLVTGAAVRPQFTVMPIVLLMARETIAGRTFEQTVQMTVITGNIEMRICQFKG